MQDNDFDKVFSHKFGKHTGEPYQEEQWSELSRRLDMHNRQRFRWVPLAAFFLLGALTAGNVFWWYLWREANQKIQNDASRTTFFKNDTVTHRTVVCLYDTIYQKVTIVQQQKVIVSQQQNSEEGPSQNLQTKNIATEDHTDNDNPLASTPAYIESSAVVQTQDSVKQQLSNGAAAEPGLANIHETPMDSPELAMPLLPEKTQAFADSTFEELLNNQPLPTKKKQSPFLYIARPRLGANAMWGFPCFPHKTAGSVWGAGIRADAEIARHFRLGAEITYQQASLKADETDALDRLEIEIPNPGSNYQFKYWQTYFLPAVTYSMHLRYEIPLHRNWTPWIGIGGQAMTSFPFDIEYEFEDENNDLELHVPAKIEANTRWQGLLFMVGAEFPLNSQLNFGVESYLLRGFSEEPGLLDRQFGLKTSLLYKF